MTAINQSNKIHLKIVVEQSPFISAVWLHTMPLCSTSSGNEDSFQVPQRNIADTIYKSLLRLDPYLRAAFNSDAHKLQHLNNALGSNEGIRTFSREQLSHTQAPHALQ